MDGGRCGDVYDPREATERLCRQLGSRPEHGVWLELWVGGGSMVGRLEAWGVDRWGPWVQLSGERWDLGDRGRPWMRY